MKKIIAIGTVIILIVALVLIIRMIQPEPDTITIKKAYYDSLKRELLTYKQIHEKASHIDISDPDVQDSIIRAYERRHGL